MHVVNEPDAMKTTEFDSSDDEVGEEQLTPLEISWLPLSVVECSQFLGICALPGCRYKDVRRNLQRDVGILKPEPDADPYTCPNWELQVQGVQDVFVFCTRGELHKYRVPCLLEAYQQCGICVHHLPFPDGGVPELDQCCQILEELQWSIEDNRKTIIHCYGGLGRSALIAACLLQKLSITMTPDKTIEILRQLRGGGAIQTVKQYNFLHEFREKFAAFQESRAVSDERSLSR